MPVIEPSYDDSCNKVFSRQINQQEDFKPTSGGVGVKEREDVDRWGSNPGLDVLA